MPSGNEERFSFEVSGLRQRLRVVKFLAFERMSTPFEINLTLASENEIGPDDVIGQNALLIISWNSDERFFHGIVNVFSQTGEIGRFYMYEARVVPVLWKLSMSQDCRIFQNQTVEEIVSQVLREHGITSDLFAFHLQNALDSREYCVQYRETNLAFVSRLLEEEGLFYFFRHFRDRHRMVVGDSTVIYQTIDGDQQIGFNPGGGLVPDEETIRGFSRTRRILPGKITLRDYDFRRSSLDLTSMRQAESFEDLEIYDYPGEYTAPEKGRQLAGIRLQEAQANVNQIRGDGNCTRFVSGHVFSLANHEIQTFNGDYLLTEVQHLGTQPQSLEERHSGSQSCSYNNRFTGIPSAGYYRAGLKTPKPLVEGIQTAMVVGRAGEESFTDDAPYGMVKVQFHWDRLGRNDENSTCWLRVAYPYAGERHGVQFTPLVGDEVLVAFLEGDPDQPVVLASLFKGSHQAIVNPANMVQNMILTPYQHRMAFNDNGGSIALNTGGGQSVNMADGEDTSPSGNSIRISTSDGHCIHLASGTSLQGIEIKTQGGNFVRLDDAADKVEIDSPGFVRLHQGSNNQNMDSQATHIWRGENHISITDQSIHMWNGDYHVLVDAGQVKLYSGGNAIRLGPDMISITHESKIQLSVGGSTITMTPSTVRIMGGPMIKMNC